MKKFVILTLVLSVALLICCFVAVSVPSASALTTILPDTGLVGDNILFNSDFSIPILSTTNDRLASVSVDSWYAMYSSVSPLSGGGVTVTSSGGSYQGLAYIFELDPVSVSLCTSVYIQPNNQIFYGLRGYNGSTWVLIGASTYNSSSSFSLITKVFTFDASLYSRYKFELFNVSNGSFKILWSKFELGSSFTGYVPNSYSNFGYNQGFSDARQIYELGSPIVKDNLLPDSYGSDWIFTGEYSDRYSPVTLEEYDGFSLNVGTADYPLRFSVTGNSFSAVSDPSTVYYTFRSLPSDYYTFTASITGTSYILYAGGAHYSLSNFGSGSSVLSVSGSFSGYVDFGISFSGSVTINWVKLERSTQFTGYVTKDFSYYGYEDGYLAGYSVGDSAGYNRGFSAGSDAFSYRSYDFSYSDVVPGAVPGPGNIRYSKGFIDLFGITSAAELVDCSFSLVPGWFTSNNYSILSSGFVFLSENDAINGVMIYCSPEVSVTPSSDYTVLSYIMIFDTYSLYVTIDPLLPSSPNPTTYPDIYRCSVSMQKGFTEYLEQVNTVAHNQGYSQGLIVGFDRGFTDGKVKGYNEGLKTAKDGNWMSLMSALIDIPVSTVTSLLNYDFFGINMFNVLKLLITLSLFFFIMRLIIAKVG